MKKTIQSLFIGLIAGIITFFSVSLYQRLTMTELPSVDQSRLFAGPTASFVPQEEVSEIESLAKYLAKAEAFLFEIKGAPMFGFKHSDRAELSRAELNYLKGMFDCALRRAIDGCEVTWSDKPDKEETLAEEDIPAGYEAPKPTRIFELADKRNGGDTAITIKTVEGDPLTDAELTTLEKYFEFEVLKLYDKVLAKEK